MAAVNMVDSCFLEHPDFDIILKQHVVQRITRATFDWREQRQYYEALPQHKRHRYIVYCNIARWVYGWLGFGNRRPLAACIVKKVRENYPPPEVEAGQATVSTYTDRTGYLPRPIEDDDNANDGMPVLRGDDKWSHTQTNPTALFRATIL